MKIIFGLGNPEKKYFNTYHNIGFLFADSIADDLGVEFKFKSSANSEIAEINITKQELCEIFGVNKQASGNEKIILVKPHTYMNLSGDAVRAVMKKYGAKLEDIIVVLDDIDLMIGKFRIRDKGSAGTHNGLRNIVERVGCGDFMRVRIGIDSENRGELIDYVLSNISSENLIEINKTINEAKKSLIERII